MAGLTSIQKARRKKSFYSWTGALLLALTVLVLNFIVSYVPVRLDTSEGKIFSLSRASKDILGKLDDTLLVQVVFSGNLPPQFKLNEQYIRDLLSEYKRASSGKVRIEYVDPSKSEKVRRQVLQMGIAPVQLNVRERGRLEVKECFMGLNMRYGDINEAIAFIQETSGLEYEISQRIKKLIEPGEVKIGLITNGEPLAFDHHGLEQLQPVVRERFTVEAVDLNEIPPPGLKALWLLGPTQQLSHDEVQRLRDWVRGGGTLGILLDRVSVELNQFRVKPIITGLDPLLEEWGIKNQAGLIADLKADRIQVQSNRGYVRWVNVVEFPYFPLVTDLNRDTPVTKSIDGVSFPFVAPILFGDKVPTLTYTSLAKSSQYSWLDPLPSDLSPLVEHKKPNGALEGPFDLAVTIEGSFDPDKGPEGEKGRVILTGTSKFIRTDYPPRQQNFALFMNLLDWSVQDESLLSIRSKGAALRPIRSMSETAQTMVKYVLMGTLPLLSLLVGLFIWRRQKMRRAMLPLFYRDA